MRVEGTNLHLVLHIRQAVDGTFSAVLDSIDQASVNIPVETVSFDGTNLRLSIMQVSATYTASLNKNGQELKGIWNEGKSRSLTFKRLPEGLPLAPPPEIGGQWQGTLIEDGAVRNIHLYIDTNNCTQIVGKLYLSDVNEDRNGVPVPKIIFRNGVITFSLKSPRLSYSGTLDNDSSFNGVWDQKIKQPLVFKRVPQTFGTYERPERCGGGVQ